MASEEGLNAYGAFTWGQFFVYQGFNDRVGWMHTSSGVDNIDEYLETIVKKGDGLYYRYGGEERPLKARTVTVPFKTPSGHASRDFTVYATHHGPIVRATDGKWVSIRLMQDPVHALTQSYSRTKARSYKAFRDTMELHTNSSNNTVYADADGTIAYFHSNFIPRRDPTLRLDEAGGRQRSGNGMERRAVDRRDAKSPEPAELAGSITRTIGRGPRLAPTVRKRTTIHPTWNVAPLRRRAGSMRFESFSTQRTSRPNR